jgi:hypothetical protein
MSWEDVARLNELSQVNMELAIALLDDCIKHSQEARKYLEKSGQTLNKCQEGICPGTPVKRY